MCSKHTPNSSPDAAAWVHQENANLLQPIATSLVAKQRITKQSYGDGKAFMMQVNKALSCPPIS